MDIVHVYQNSILINTNLKLFTSTSYGIARHVAENPYVLAGMPEDKVWRWRSDLNVWRRFDSNRGLVWGTLLLEVIVPPSVYDLLINSSLKWPVQRTGRKMSFSVWPRPVRNPWQRLQRAEVAIDAVKTRNPSRKISLLNAYLVSKRPFSCVSSSFVASLPDSIH